MKKPKDTKSIPDSGPRWDADMEYWLNRELTIYDNPTYKAPEDTFEWTESGEIIID